MQATEEVRQEVSNTNADISASIIARRDNLIAARDAQLADAFGSLDSERESLTRESAAIAEASRNLAELLPAKARAAQAEHDRLLLAGDREGAAAKLAEQKEAEGAPATMTARQREIDARIEAIAAEKQAIARRVFADWYSKLQGLIREVEHALFLELLDKTLHEMYSYQELHHLTATIERPFSHLVQDRVIEGLTSDANTVEWKSGQKWYRGRA